MKKLIDKTLKLSNEFASRGNTYDKRSRIIDLVEEIGELAQAVHIVEGYKFTNNPAKQKSVEDVADGICDILYELILLSLDYDIDLEAEYQKMIDHLSYRVRTGEFDHQNISGKK